MDDTRRRSRWIMRILEWDDPRARYPNLWHEGMPRLILAFDSVASRLRLGDLIAVYSPASQKHPERSGRFVGLAKVTGLRLGTHDASAAWIDLVTAHRFEPPFDAGEEPRRVFLCCDPRWPDREVALFRKVLGAAVAAGFRPAKEEKEEEEREGKAEPRRSEEAVEGNGHAAVAELEAPPVPAPAPKRPVRAVRRGRLFAGADYSGDMRDPRDATWLAVVELVEPNRLRVVRLEAVGRAGLQSRLRDADAELQQVEAFGLDFPFGLPLAFAESLLGGPFPEEGWWALARRFEKMSRPEYLVALQEFRDAHGELKRVTDEAADAFSPLHRVHPDLGPMTYHGIRLIAEERSRYAVRPFESARGRLLLEVYPGAALRRLQASGPAATREERGAASLALLRRAEHHPVDMDERCRRRCLEKPDALDAVLAARCAATAVLGGEAGQSPEELAPAEAERVRREGWIYGLAS